MLPAMFFVVLALVPLHGTIATTIAKPLDVGEDFGKAFTLYQRLIVSLNDLKLLSAKKDTSLRPAAPLDGFQNLLHPDSYRKSTTQVAAIGWAALSSMHNDMNAVQRQMKPLPGQLLELLRVTKDGSIKEVLETFPKVKDQLLEAYKECRYFSKEAKDIYSRLVNITQEVFVASGKLANSDAIDEEDRSALFTTLQLAAATQEFTDRLYASCEDNFKMVIFPLHEYVLQQYEMTKDSHQFVKADREYSLRGYAKEVKKIDTYSHFLYTLGDFYLKTSENHFVPQLMNLMITSGMKNESARQREMERIRKLSEEVIQKIQEEAAERQWRYTDDLKDILDEVDKVIA